MGDFKEDFYKKEKKASRDLAYFDIVLDQHLRQVRPSSISESEEMFKYVKDEFKPLKNIENHLRDNMYAEYLYTLDNEFYVKFKQEINRVVGGMTKNEDPEDKVNNLIIIINF